MMSSVRIYLSGSIKKGRWDSRGREEFWSESDEDKIRSLIQCRAELLNPAKSPIRRSDFFVNYGCDLHLVQTSDVILVDLRTQKGIGVGAELMYAQFAQIPVVGWVPKNSYYRRDKVEDVFGEDLLEWTHPFVFGLCDSLAEDLESACQFINQMLLLGTLKKNPDRSPSRAIEAFKGVYGADPFQR